MTGTETLSGVTISDGSTLQTFTGTVFDLENTTTLNGTVTFEGGGTFVLDPGPSSIVGGSGGGTLDIAVGATLTGSGDIGNAGTTALTLNNSGTVDANVSGKTLDIDTGNTITNTGTLEATNCGALEIDDAVNNAGGTIKALHGGTITFDGGTLDDESATAGVAGGLVEATARCATITFDNVTVTLDLAVAGGGGTIKASNGGAIVFNCGTINSATSAPVSGGLIEALTCGIITFNSTTVYNQGSRIEADGVGAMIMLAGAMILGGTLETSAHGVIETVACSGNSTLDGVTIATGSTIQVDDHTTLTLQDTVDDNATVTNDGTITLVQGCDPSLIVNGDLTLAGHGTVVLSGDTDSIVGAGKGEDTDTLHNANTIEGAGTIGGEGLVFINQSCGVVDADTSGHTLVLDTGTTVTNLGVLEATHGGILEIDDNVCNIGGTIAAYGCGSVVELEGVTIKGGMFLTDDSTSGDRGVIEVVSTDSATVFDGGGSHAISIGGFVHVDAGATLKLIGTIDLAAHCNNGTIDLAQINADSGNIGADLLICGTVTLTGSGGIVMEGDAAKITAAAPGAALHNDATISGAGSIGIGDNWLHLVNETDGVINANNASADNLTIDIGCNTIHNHGLVEATCGGTLVLNSDVDNSCGTIQAVGCDTTVVLDQITVSCGTLETHCGGLIQTVCGDSTLDNVTIGCGAAVEVTNGSTLTLEHTLNSSGTITVDCDATLYLTCVGLDGGTIKDNGTVEVTADSTIGGNAVIDGDVGSLVIDCGKILTADNATLQNLDVCNHGTLGIDSDHTLALSNVVVHGGAIEGTDASGCIIASTIDVTGDSKFCDVSLSGGGLTVEGGVKLTLSGGTVSDIAINGTDASGCIIASTIDVTHDSAFSDASVTGGGLTVGCGVTLTTDDVTLVDLNVTNHGTLQIDGTHTLTLDGTAINGGTIDDYTDSDSTVIPSNIDVHGDSAISNATIEGEGNSVVGSPGVLTVGCGVALTLDHTTLEDLNLTNNGTLHVAGSCNVILDNTSVTNNGCIEVDTTHSGAILALDDDSTIGGGALKINSLGALDIATGNDGPGHGATLAGVCVTDNGTIDVDVTNSGAILTLDEGTAIHGCGTMTVELHGTLNVDGGTTTINLGGTITNNGTLEASCGGTLDIVSHVDNSSGALEATSGGKLDIESAICGGSATIHGATLEFDASSNVHVTFDNGSEDSPTYGMLVLSDLPDFHGTISNFTGTCADSAHSDVIDVTDIDFCSDGFRECYDSDTGLLTISDGAHTAQLKFDDFDGRFVFKSDGNGGTDIYDPPVGGAKDAPSTVTAGASDGHTDSPVNQIAHVTDHATSPSNPGRLRRRPGFRRRRRKTTLSPRREISSRLAISQ